ncbi:hypothetical protein F4X88_17305 [Candidatus Poribacteria bacterium]|nr:hypothetical protein [Candidatus Poribacteria bacterium]
MKNVLIIALLLVSVLFSLSGFAQDYMKWGIPENATLRLGKGQIYDLKHSPNGDLIAVASSIGVWLYDAHSGKEIRLLQKHSDRVEVDTGNLITTLSKHNNWVKALTFSSDGKILASGSQDGTVLVWDLNKIMKSQ